MCVPYEVFWRLGRLDYANRGSRPDLFVRAVFIGTRVRVGTVARMDWWWKNPDRDRAGGWGEGFSDQGCGGGRGAEVRRFDRG